MNTALILLGLGAFLEGFERYSSWPKGKEWWRIPVGIAFTLAIANYSQDFWRAFLIVGLGVPLGAAVRLILARPRS